jgi:hypothetical protein
MNTWQRYNDNLVSNVESRKVPYLFNLLFYAFQVQNVLQVLHSSLQNFSVTFDELKKFSRPNIYPENIAGIRKRVIAGMAQHLNQVNNN